MSGTEISIERTFPYMFQTNQPTLVMAPTGVCDPSMSDTRERLTPHRTATAFFTGTMAAAGADIIFPATAVQIFTAGPGGGAAAAGGGTGLLARSDTNAQSSTNGGGVVRADQAFVATGMWFQWLSCYTVPHGDPAIASTANNSRKGSAFLRSPVSPYDKVIQQLLSSVINPTVKNGRDAACEFDLFAADTWASGSGVSDARIGFGGIGGSFYHLAVPEVSLGQGTGKELLVNLTQNRRIEIESDAANPTPGTAVDVIAALRMVIVGYPICATAGSGGGIDYARLADAIVARGGAIVGETGYDIAKMNAAIDEARAKAGGRIYGR